MAKKINVSIPDKLLTRMEPFRDRLAISRICQRAIERAIQLEEVAVMDIPEREKLIKRLQIERVESPQIWQETGFRHGVEDANKLHFEDFNFISNVYIGMLFPEDKRDDSYVSKSINVLKGYEVVIDRIKIMKSEGIDIDIYMRGWIQGVMEIWKQIKEDVLTAIKQGGKPMEEEN